MGFQLPDLTAVAPSTGGGSFELLPAGDYRLQVIDFTEEKITNDGTGKYVTAKFSVVEGDYEDVSFFVNFNIANKNIKAVEIAWRDLAALGHAFSPPVLVGNSDALLYKPFMAKVGIEKSKNPQYPDDKNKIAKYYPADEAPPPAIAAPTQLRPAPVVAQNARPAPAAARQWAATRR